MAVIAALSGSLLFNPETDTLTNEKGEAVKLTPPPSVELPSNGFDVKDSGYVAPAKDGSSSNLVVKLIRKIII